VRRRRRRLRKHSLLGVALMIHHGLTQAPCRVMIGRAWQEVVVARVPVLLGGRGRVGQAQHGGRAHILKRRAGDVAEFLRLLPEVEAVDMLSDIA
jgi:hypothetical protein